MQILKIYTDGSCLKNPGGVGGYGGVLLTEPPTLISGHIPAPTTNNRAEITAVLYALFHAQSLGYKRIKIYSDSEYTINCATGVYNRNANLDLWDLIDLALSTLHYAEFHWVRGHNGNEYNELADKLANEGAHKYPLPIKDPNKDLTVTEVGERLNPKMKATELNKLLITSEYQYRNGKLYLPTSKGKPFSILTPFADHKGNVYYKLSWKNDMIKEIQNLLDSLLN